MNGITRLLRLLLPGRNPLARGTDRLRSALVVGVALLAMLLVPIALTYGSVTYSGLAAKGEQQAHDWHQTVAVLTEDAPAGGTGVRGEPANTTTRVMAEWRLPDGATRTGRVPVDSGTPAGSRVTIWLDAQGTPVGPPVASSDAAVAAVLVASTGWLIATGLLTLGYHGARRLLDRHALRAWEQEWAKVEPGWRNQLR